MFACIHNAGSRQRCLDDLVTLARGFSPLVEETSPATVVLDISGCERLFGSAHSISREIARRAARAELTTNVAVAGNPDVAVCAAVGMTGVTVIPEGREAAAIKDLPVDVLRQTARMPSIPRTGSFTKSSTSNEPGASQPGAARAIAEFEEASGGADEIAQQVDEILETLELWGIRTFGDLAALPEPGLSERLGPVGVRLRRLARGQSRRSLLLKKSDTQFQKSIELDDRIELLEPLSFMLSGLLEALCTDLKSRALAANEISLRMRLEDRSVYEQRMRLPFPMRSSKVLLRLLALDIQTHPPQSAIVAITIAAEPVEPRALQNGLFQPLAPEPEKLELTLVRLMRLVGPENVGSPELLDTYRPDAFRILRFKLKDRVRRKGRRSVRAMRRWGDGETRGHGDAAMGRWGEGEPGRKGDGERGRWGEGETRGRGDAETRRWGDGETRGRGDAETRRWGDGETRGLVLPAINNVVSEYGHPFSAYSSVIASSPHRLIPPSPHRLIPSSPHPLIPSSPHPLIPPSPPLPIPVLGFRVFRPPLEATVEEKAGKLDWIRAESETQKRIIGGRIVRLAGPWRTSGEWWKPDGWVHEEWDVALGETGALYRIYRDLRTDRWFVFGAYD